MKRYQSKKRQEIKGTDIGGEDLSENKQLLEDAERFEESKGRSKADTQKRQSISKMKKERSRNEKKAMERFGETKNVRCKTKVTLVIKTQQKLYFRSGCFLFILFEKTLRNVANLDQKA